VSIIVVRRRFNELAPRDRDWVRVPVDRVVHDPKRDQATNLCTHAQAQQFARKGMRPIGFCHHVNQLQIDLQDRQDSCCLVSARGLLDLGFSGATNVHSGKTNL
jgi:hypothetical protein